MLKYFKLRRPKSLFSKSKRSISSPRSIPHVRNIDKINPAQLDSGQKLINDSIRTMSDNLMAKFSPMFDQYQSRQHNLFRQNTYLQNKKHMLTCQRWDWLL